MKINVTKRNIEKGKRKSCGACPVALALRRTFKVTEVSVASRIVIFGLSPQACFETPDEVLRFMDRFDRRCKVEPFSFELEV